MKNLFVAFAMAAFVLASAAHAADTLSTEAKIEAAIDSTSGTTKTETEKTATVKTDAKTGADKSKTAPTTVAETKTEVKAEETK